MLKQPRAMSPTKNPASCNYGPCKKPKLAGYPLCTEHQELADFIIDLLNHTGYPDGISILGFVKYLHDKAVLEAEAKKRPGLIIPRPGLKVE